MKRTSSTKKPIKGLPKTLIIEKDYPSFTVNILGNPWQVCLLNKEQIIEEHKTELKGCCMYSDYTIHLLYEGTLFVLERTFFHEWAHAATAHAIGSRDDAEDKVDQEFLANAIGDALAQLMLQDFPFSSKYNDKQKAKIIKDLLQAEYI